MKADSVKQEFEKQDELKKCALRAVYALLQIQQVKKSQQMQDFLTQVCFVKIFFLCDINISENCI